jgi:hypothetical protein
MRFFLAYLLAFVAAVSALAVDFESASKEIRDITENENVELVTANLGNDLKKVDIVIDGVVEGYLVQTADGGVLAFEADGTEIDLDAEEVEGLEKRNKVKILLKLAKLIKKFGQKVWRFLNCVGYTSTLLNCADKFANCGVYGDAPQDCISGLACLGSAGRKCKNA